MAKGSLPGWAWDPLHLLREIGNNAAHPRLDKAAGTIIEVEPGEAELGLDALRALFEHYWVRPEKTRKARENLNEKLVAAGRAPIKE